MTNAPRRTEIEWEVLMLHYRSVWMGILLVGWLSSTGPATAQALASEKPCDLLFVPEGYELTCTVKREPGADDWQVSVHPTDGMFAGLSELTLTPVDERIADPADWLQKQVKIDVTGLEDALTGFLDDEDTPFAEESWWTSLRGLKDVVHSISDLPLDACDEPHEGDDGWVIDCDWGIGSLQQLLTVRLVERDDTFYALRVQSMNERRHRHLQAIANSF
ncbi:MAG: hypothetical protein ACR2QJ_14815 [Geminicoccaceae bacterium]